MAIVPLTLACVMSITQQYNFPKETMFALLLQEGGTVGQSSRNTNGSYDHGPYQVNDVNVPAIAKAFSMSPAEARERLRDDGCFSAQAAGWLLNGHLTQTGQIWEALGRYHSRTPVHAARYKEGLYEKVQRLYQPQKPKRTRKSD